MTIRACSGLKAFVVGVAMALVGGWGGGGGGEVAPPPPLPLMVDSLGRQVAEADFGAGDPAATGVDGVAVEGGPLVNAEVSLVDNAGITRTATTDAMGYYRIDGRGLTAPFVVKVFRPGGWHWFSASASAGNPRTFATVHLSGLTDKTLSLAADSTGLGGIAASVTPALLAAQANALPAAKARLRSALEVPLRSAGLEPSGYDPVTSPLRADTADRHAQFLQRLRIWKNDTGDARDQGRTVVLATLAGEGADLVDGPAALARFNRPTDVALDAAGNLYVADSANNVIRKITPAGEVSTFAGSGSANYANANGSSASFNGPTGVAVDAIGNVYVADRGNYLVRKISPSGSVTTLAGGGVPGHLDAAGTAARFEGPQAVAVDQAGNVYVADQPGPANLFLSGSLRKVTAQGVVTTVAAQPAGGQNVTFRTYGGVAVDRDGAVHVVCTVPGSLGKVCKITAAGVQTILEPRPGLGSIGGSTGLAVDAAGSVYVSDFGTIRKLTPDGDLVIVAGTGINGPNGPAPLETFRRASGLALDAAGNLYVADQDDQVVRKVGAGGVVSTVAGRKPGGFNDGPASAASFSAPSAVAVQADGSVLVADTGNHAIRRIARSGAVTTVAGTGTAGFANGTGTGASFNQPTGIAVDGASNIYVADRGNNALRKITPAGPVTTLAGSGVAGFADAAGPQAAFNYPMHVAVDGAANVYVSDIANASIRKITPASVVSTIAGLGHRLPTPEEFAVQGFVGVGALAVDAAGRVFFEGRCDYFRFVLSAAQCIFQVPAGGTASPYRTETDPQGTRPAMAIDTGGNLFYGRYGQEGKVFKLDPAGVETQLWSTSESSSFVIAGLAVAADGTLVLVNGARAVVHLLLP
jgi:sugar lactone lactonase YvrE